MGRPRKSNPLNLPPRVYWKHGQFWYEHPGTRKWEALGSDVNKAKRHVARNSSFSTITYWLGEFLAAQAIRVTTGDLSPRTHSDYTANTEPLGLFFGRMEPAGIEPKHVAQYLDAGREMGRAVRANREKACLSAMFTWLIRTGQGGVTTNPCIGIRRNKEVKRTRYVEDDEMRRDLADAPESVRMLCELVYRTLQRPEDILNWTHANIIERDGKRVLRNRQSKTGVNVDIEITHEIEQVLKKSHGVTLIHRRDGRKYSYDGLCAMLKRRQRGTSWGFYDLKAKGATDMWLNGVPLEQIQILCGHDSVTTTERYVKQHWREVVAPNKVVRRA